MKQLQVLVVDDSAVVRQVLGALLAADPAISLMAAVADPILALARMRVRWPDVIVLDIEMPRMDGLTFLRQLMRERPTPVVICSSLASDSVRMALDALAAGAVKVIAKPTLGLKQFLIDSGDELVGAVKAAAQANLASLAVPARHSADAVLAAPCAPAALARTTERVVALGTSTGGTQALERVLVRLPRVCPGLVVVQHMPEKFTAQFAARLDALCQIEVKEAADGDRVLPGRALIAPGGRHLLLRRCGGQYLAEVRDGPLVNRHKPSVDVLFRSVAQAAGANALGVIMTGMGDDGAAGLLEMRSAGAHTIAQDEASCVVYGMPREAVRRGAAVQSVALDGIAAQIVGLRPA